MSTLVGRAPAKAPAPLADELEAELVAIEQQLGAEGAEITKLEAELASLAAQKAAAAGDAQEFAELAATTASLAFEIERRTLLLERHRGEEQPALDAKRLQLKIARAGEKADELEAA
ncbi:MAG: hypothetical protein ABR569_01425 [Gaiellaceae bacterium]